MNTYTIKRRIPARKDSLDLIQALVRDIEARAEARRAAWALALSLEASL